MAEVFTRFAEPVHGPDGRAYQAQVCGAPRSDGLWEGWIEFFPLDVGTPLRTERETTQPNRHDTLYWASGLTPIYLDGALKRTRRPPIHRDLVPAAEPVFTGPAPHSVDVVEEPFPVHDAVLDPFAAYSNGEANLRRELGALSEWHLVNIITAYRLSSQPGARLHDVPAQALIEIIVNAVRREGLENDVAGE